MPLRREGCFSTPTPVLFFCQRATEFLHSETLSGRRSVCVCVCVGLTLMVCQQIKYEGPPDTLHRRRRHYLQRLAMNTWPSTSQQPSHRAIDIGLCRYQHTTIRTLSIFDRRQLHFHIAVRNLGAFIEFSAARNLFRSLGKRWKVVVALAKRKRQGAAVRLQAFARASEARKRVNELRKQRWANTMIGQQASSRWPLRNVSVCGYVWCYASLLLWPSVFRFRCM